LNRFILFAKIHNVLREGKQKLAYAKLSEDVRLPCSLLLFCCDSERGWLLLDELPQQNQAIVGKM
jgi:hypothetical protein